MRIILAMLLAVAACDGSPVAPTSCEVTALLRPGSGMAYDTAGNVIHTARVDTVAFMPGGSCDISRTDCICLD